MGILERMEYTGYICNFKTYSKSYKLKKQITNSVEDMAIFPDTQEAIVSQAQWDSVQELRQNKRRPTKAERQVLFAGLLFCHDCGSKLHFGACKSFDRQQDRYVFPSTRVVVALCSAHYIREDVLREIVLKRIQEVNKYIQKDAEGFQEEWLQCNRQDQEKRIRDDKKQVGKVKKHLANLEIITRRVYEDYALGNISLKLCPLTTLMKWNG